ncbi:MAG: type III pantothenate kinase, partial [Proteobacteria bacterium]|nr:type III pantothenate kinase [Pseudomonadota bacterium]
MLLAIDIGNTNIVLGLFEQKDLKQTWRLNSDKRKNPDNYAIDIIELLVSNSFDPTQISGIIISSVVRDLTPIIKEALSKFFAGKILIIGEENVDLGIEILLKNKKEVGADRLINAVAAYNKFAGDLIIVDFGTATTFDIVEADGSYAGGVIAPGVNLSLKALYEAASALPEISIKSQKNVIGKSTIEAMNSGIYFGYISLVEGLINRIKKEYGKEMKVVATGGLSVLFNDAISVINYLDGNLTLE